VTAKSLLALVAIALAAACGAPPGPPLTISDIVVPEPVPGAPVMAAYLELYNRSPQPRTIVAITSPDFARVEIHESVVENDIARMRAIPTLTLDANSHMRFEVGGMHLMLFGAKSAMNAGTPLTLEFHDDANGMVSVATTVRPRSEIAR